jgi:hypothetical protein
LRIHEPALSVVGVCWRRCVVVQCATYRENNVEATAIHRLQSLTAEIADADHAFLQKS